MHRKITYSSQEFYCRYLNLGLNTEPTMKLCSGDFFKFVDKKLDFKKLPYDIKLIDLITENCIDVDLFVELPNSYFESWDNFPIVGNNWYKDLADTVKDAGYYDLEIRLNNETELSELSHPYDEQLNERFKKRFEVTQPSKLTKYDHPNGRTFFPNEVYLSYWKAYILLEAINECMYIDRYVSKIQGIQIFKDKVTNINQRWIKQYSSIFDAISHYRTLTSLLHHLDKPLDNTYGEISLHLLDRANITSTELSSGLGILLELHNTWTRKLKNNGISQLNFALKSLKRDIYFLFQWLCGLGFSEKEMFEQWSYKDRHARSWSQLSDVLDFEEHSFKTTFELYAPIYCQDNSKYFNFDMVLDIYEKLNKYESFSPWIRSFSDLHKSINKKSDLCLVQPRLLDSLLVMTIRTEVLVRTMLLNLSGKTEPDDFKIVLRELANYFKDESCKNILIAVTGKNEYSLTKLKDRPESIFNKIDQSEFGKKWPNKQKYFFKVILKFITSRNYFAHHYYKDHEFNTHTNKLCGEVLTSCLQTILFINDSVD